MSSKFDKRLESPDQMSNLVQFFSLGSALFFDYRAYIEYAQKILGRNEDSSFLFDIKFNGEFSNYTLSFFRLIMNISNLSDLTLEDLLPHRDNMLLVNEILEVDITHALTRSQVKKSWPMAELGGVHPLILVELAAQTAGVCNGWDRIQTLGRDSEKLGWLVGIKKAEFFIENLPLNKSILCRSENTHNFANLREVFCEQHMEDALIGKITLQLFQA